MMTRLKSKTKSSDDEDEMQPILPAEEPAKEATKDEAVDDESANKNCEFTMCKKEYPKHIFFIIGNEFCERFCFYGMKAVLQTYLLFQLKLAVDTASSLYHAFTMVAYFTPLLGAILADSYIGRYWTIVSLSSVYVVGNIVMAGTSAGDGYLAGALVGMFTIAVGTGGIKPCVAAFGADQFPSSMPKAQESFFSLFYVAINAGALLSQIVTPEVKSVSCFGYDSCWVLAFGLPAILMVVALALFLVGTPFYHRVPVSGDSALKIFKAIGIAIFRIFNKNRQHVEHWLDRAVGGDISQSFVNDCKSVLRVLVLFLPLPFFWALFDQQGSRWTLQAQKMDSYISFANWSIQAEQIQIFNGLLILLSVPLFEMVVYPVAKKCNFLVRPLQRMVAGCVLAAVSFFLIGFIQIAVQSQNDALNKDDFSTYRVRAFNFHSCPFNVTQEDGTHLLTLQPQGAGVFTPGDLVNGKKLNIAPIGPCPVMCSTQSVKFGPENITPISSLTISNNCSAILAGNVHSFPDDVEYLFQIQAALFSQDKGVAKMWLLTESGHEIDGSFEQSVNSFVKLNYLSVQKPGLYKLKIRLTNGTMTESSSFLLRQGGAYTIAYDLEKGVEILIDKGPNALSVFWQFFPYLVITWSEVMFSITGLSFAFSQAPTTMKSILQAAWLLTVSFGNIIDIIVVNLKIPDKAVEFFVFAVTMCVVTLVFATMTGFYQYADNAYGSAKKEGGSAEQKGEGTYGALSENKEQENPSPKDPGEAANDC